MNYFKSTNRSGGYFDYDSKVSRLESIDTRLQDPSIWNTKEYSDLLKEKKGVSILVDKSKQIQEEYENLKLSLEFLEQDSSFLEEINSSNLTLEQHLQDLKIQTLLNEKEDSLPALISINAGAGGTESCDWALMLQRMYLMYCESKGMKTSIVDVLAGEETGIKNSTIEVQGEYAYGLLKSESGVHRLIRISPFDSNARRHTSFASVSVSPIIDDTINIQINPQDIRIDTYRSTGAGGQHINTTDSAVRITHFPTGIVVQCQNERSQHQNKDQAFKLLKSRLYQRELQERLSKQQEKNSQKSQIGWSSQIRTYTLHPYKLVKDHRSSYESSNPDNVLNGRLDEFIDAYLSWYSSEH